MLVLKGIFGGSPKITLQNGKITREVKNDPKRFSGSPRTPKSLQKSCGQSKNWAFPNARQGSESRFPEKKRVSGSKNPPFPPSPSHDHFPCVPLREKGDFLTENSLFQAEGGNGGFLDPEILFSRKWGFGALSGVGGIPIQKHSPDTFRRLFGDFPDCP